MASEWVVNLNQQGQSTFGLTFALKIYRLCFRCIIVVLIPTYHKITSSTCFYNWVVVKYFIKDRKSNLLCQANLLKINEFSCKMLNRSYAWNKVNLMSSIGEVTGQACWLFRLSDKAPICRCFNSNSFRIVFPSSTKRYKCHSCINFLSKYCRTL